MIRRILSTNGFSLVEVLVTGLIVAIAAVGTALMLSSGLAFIESQADDRIALYLAQQKLEQLRSRGFSSLEVGAALTTGCVAVTSFSPFSSTQPGEPCYTEAPPAQPPYTYRTEIVAGSFRYHLVSTFPRYTRETVVECVSADNFESVVSPCTTPLAKRITVTVSPLTLKARPVVVQTVLALR